MVMKKVTHRVRLKVKLTSLLARPHLPIYHPDFPSTGLLSLQLRVPLLQAAISLYKITLVMTHVLTLFPTITSLTLVSLSLLSFWNSFL